MNGPSRRSASADRIVQQMIVKDGMGYAATIRWCKYRVAQIEKEAAEKTAPYREVIEELEQWYADHPEVAHV